LRIKTAGSLQSRGRRGTGASWCHHRAITARCVRRRVPSCSPPIETRLGKPCTCTHCLPHWATSLGPPVFRDGVIFSFLFLQILMYISIYSYYVYIYSSTIVAGLAGYAGAYPAYPVAPPLISVANISFYSLCPNHV
jgi:hypothetical protein